MVLTSYTDMNDKTYLCFIRHVAGLTISVLILVDATVHNAIDQYNGQRYMKPTKTYLDRCNITLYNL